MPFLAHFGLTDRPFSLTPDSELYFENETHQDILASLIYAVERGEGIMKVIGEVGTGKTLICRMLTEHFIEQDASVAYIINPQNDPEWIIRAVGLDPDKSSDPFHTLNEFLLEKFKDGRAAVLLVDEAQALGHDGLEAVRRLSNLETEKSKLLQIIIFGQPELLRQLQDHGLRQLSQRIVFSFTVGAMADEVMMQYIRYRVFRSTPDIAAADRLFDESALKAIARCSAGIPRIAHIISDKSLLAAFSDNSKQVKKKHVKEAIADSPDVLHSVGARGLANWREWAMPVRLSLLGVGVLALIAWWLYTSPFGF